MGIIACFDDQPRLRVLEHDSEELGCCYTVIRHG